MICRRCSNWQPLCSCGFSDHVLRFSECGQKPAPVELGDEPRDAKFARARPNSLTPEERAITGSVAQRVGTQRFDQLETVLLRHLHVGDESIDTRSADEELKCLFGARRRVDLYPEALRTGVSMSRKKAEVVADKQNRADPFGGPAVGGRAQSSWASGR